VYFGLTNIHQNLELTKNKKVPHPSGLASPIPLNALNGTDQLLVLFETNEHHPFAPMLPIFKVNHQM